MRIKQRFITSGGFIRQENFGEIKEVLINEDFLHPDNESIAICFRNKGSSGIIELKTSEFERLVKTVRSKVHLIKNIEMFKEPK
jgi:hypothetical protein